MILKFIIRELKALFRDKGFLLLALGGPLFYSVFYPLPYTHDVARNIPVAIIDEDKSPVSGQLIRMLRGAEEIAPVSYNTLPEAKEGLEKRDVFAVLVLDKNFSKNLAKGVPASAHFYTDASYPIYYKQTVAAFQRILKTFSAGIEIKKLQAYGAGASAAVLRSPLRLGVHQLYSPAGAYRNYLVPAVFVTVAYQIILMVIGLRAGALYEQKKKYSARLKPFQIWLGKMAAFLCFMAGYFIYLFVLMFRLYGFSGGENVGAWFLFYILFAVATVGLGLTLGGLFKARESSVMFIVVTSLPLVFMSGVIWPVWKMPLVIRMFRLCIPLTYGITGMVRLFIMNASWAEAWPYACGLSMLAAVFCVTSYYTIQRRYPTQI